MSRVEIYKLHFLTGVHFGDGLLNSTNVMFHADSLFSALFCEALKDGVEEEFYEAAKAGRLKISDCFPFNGEVFFLPKPGVRVKGKDNGSSETKKFFKKLNFIPADQLRRFMEGSLEQKDAVKEIYQTSIRTMAAVRREETLPYQVGVCRYRDGAGLYVIVQMESEKEKELFESLMEMLSATGIGGKRASGFGRFTFSRAVKGTNTVIDRIGNEKGTKLLLSTALPKKDELEKALEGASYTLQPRSGFVYSDSFSDEQRKRRTLFVMKSGSCFENSFDGDIYDVSDSMGEHPVYRYAKPMFMMI